jgi:hypothetical protein
LAILLTASILGADTNKRATFDVAYAFFKELGVANAQIDTNGAVYSIKVEAKANGLAKLLSRNRQEVYTSEGYIENGQFVPTKFTQQRSHSDIVDITIYTFDNFLKKITKRKEKFEDNKIISQSSEVLEFYANNDILTLYFNIAENLKSIKQGEHRIYYAVGANPKDGKVDVIAPIGAKLDEVNKSCKAQIDDRTLIVIINQKIFQSENGELFILFDKSGETKKAVLKNVILFGDITGKNRAMTSYKTGQ